MGRCGPEVVVDGANVVVDDDGDNEVVADTFVGAVVETVDGDGVVGVVGGGLV